MNKYYYEYPYVDGEQRQFGWTTSKIIRPLKSKIGHVRRSAADKLYQSGLKSGAKNEAVEAELEKIQTITNKSLRNSLLKHEVPKANATVAYGSGAGKSNGATIYRENIKPGFGNLTKYAPPRDEGVKFLKRILKKEGRSSGIAMSKDSGIEFLAHELGHAQGKIAKGKRGLISASDPRNLKNSGDKGSISHFKERSRFEIRESGGKKVGFKESLKDLLTNSRNSRAIIAEENAATREGIKMLKRHGATPEELKLAERNLGLVGDTYRNAGKKSVKTSLGRVIDIPSRRGSRRIIV